ncbi:DJ-1/PfpI/YhbO family deglycase/protease [Candidatus Fermentibacteria bacterium]|nr:DJ-1/PfpI/YhbO family deglycase/protease [Candidatus Fermentibacteria bacterium]
MARIAAIVEDMFEDSEYLHPVEAFEKNGHRVINVGMKKGKTVRGKKQGTEVRIDESIEAVSPADFDALLIPGGYSPDKLRAHSAPVSFVRDFVVGGKPVFMICHGPQLLITADVLRGRRATGWKSIAQDIRNAGAEYVDAEVVSDGNLLSSRHPGDLKAFTESAIRQLSKGE